ncbi:YncE family protein [Thermaerobacillus caldiproteolyticus]|uniref:YncE family protein n=1 Tax=Thermaerobacillus caldiproteolyticus TaxID=247480 RepID=UPI00188B0139|nr:YncE family protein [Anoxybacillus caldiproteolyticus]QPA32749.1 YncE family protein [Anoxybacillus caldiproteolyticus]
MRLVCALIVSFCVLLAGCESETLPSISRQIETLISVNVKDGSVTFFDLYKGTTVAQWNLKQPVKGGALFPDGNTLLLYGDELDRVYAYDVVTGKLKNEWKTGKGIVSALVSNDGNRIFLADGRRKAIRMFQMNGKESGEIKVGSQPLTLLQNRTGTRLYVIDFYDEKAYVIDVDKRQVMDTFSVPKFAFGGLLREHEQELWVGGHGSGSTVETKIHVYSLKTGKLLKLIDAPDMPVSFVETNEGVFGLSHGSNMVRKWSKSGQQEASLTVGANPFTMIGANGRLYVASYDSDEIYVIDERTLRIVARWKTGKGPFQLLIRGEDVLGKENSVNR